MRSILLMAIVAPMILLSACGSSKSGSSLASETAAPVSAKEAFKNDAAVKIAAQSLSNHGFVVESSDVRSIELGGGCGFAGCNSTLLMALTFKTPGSNTRSASVTAIVEKPSHPSLGAMSIKLVEIKKSGNGEDITVDNRSVIQAFRKAAFVMQETALHVAQGEILDGEPETIGLRGACGFVGCDALVLVTQKFKTAGANTQSSSLSAVVEVPSLFSDHVLKVYAADFAPATAP